MDQVIRGGLDVGGLDSVPESLTLVTLILVISRQILRLQVIFYKISNRQFVNSVQNWCERNGKVKICEARLSLVWHSKHLQLVT